MKKIILEQLSMLEANRLEGNKPPGVIEIDLKKAIQEVLTTELQSLIEAGTVEVVGITINKDRLLTLKNNVPQHY